MICTNWPMKFEPGEAAGAGANSGERGTHVKGAVRLGTLHLIRICGFPRQRTGRDGLLGGADWEQAVSPAGNRQSIRPRQNEQQPSRLTKFFQSSSHSVAVKGWRAAEKQKFGKQKAEMTEANPEKLKGRKAERGKAESGKREIGKREGGRCPFLRNGKWCVRLFVRPKI